MARPRQARLASPVEQPAWLRQTRCANEVLSTEPGSPHSTQTRHFEGGSMPSDQRPTDAEDPRSDALAELVRRGWPLMAGGAEEGGSPPGGSEQPPPATSSPPADPNPALTAQ